MEDQKWSENKTDPDQECAAAAEKDDRDLFYFTKREKVESMIGKKMLFLGEWDILDARFRSRLRNV